MLRRESFSRMTVQVRVLSLLANVVQVHVDRIFLDYDRSCERGDNDVAELVVARSLVVRIRMIESVLDGVCAMSARSA